MHTISFKIDDDLKKKIDEIIKSKNFKTLDDFILHAIEDEITKHSRSLNYDKDDDIADTLLNLAEELSDMDNQEEKVKYLAKYDDFLQNNKTIIEEKYSALMTGILRSL
mgnify:CR=1 FL=1